MKINIIDNSDVNSWKDGTSPEVTHFSWERTKRLWRLREAGEHRGSVLHMAVRGQLKDEFFSFFGCFCSFLPLSVPVISHWDVCPGTRGTTAPGQCPQRRLATPPEGLVPLPVVHWPYPRDTHDVWLWMHNSLTSPTIANNSTVNFMSRQTISYRKKKKKKLAGRLQFIFPCNDTMVKLHYRHKGDSLKNFLWNTDKMTTASRHCNAETTKDASCFLLKSTKDGFPSNLVGKKER